MGYFTWDPQAEDLCDPIPEDACDVNYCPIPYCEWDEVTEGYKALIAIRVDEDGDDEEVNCVGALIKKFAVKFPAIEVTDSTSSEYRDGSFSWGFNFAIQESDHVIYPLIIDNRSHVKHYRPAPVAGRFKIISKNQSISPAPDVFPALADWEINTDEEPEFYLGANAARLLCPVGTGLTVQLLKISIPE